MFIEIFSNISYFYDLLLREVGYRIIYEILIIYK